MHTNTNNRPRFAWIDPKQPWRNPHMPVKRPPKPAESPADPTPDPSTPMPIDVDRQNEEASGEQVLTDLQPQVVAEASMTDRNGVPDPEPEPIADAVETFSTPENAEMVASWRAAAIRIYGRRDEEITAERARMQDLVTELQDRVDELTQEREAQHAEEIRKRNSADTKIAWEAVIAALLSNTTIKSAAETSGVSERSIYRLMENPDFVARFRDAQNEVIRESVERHRALRRQAADTLQKCLTDEDKALSLRAVHLIFRMGAHRDFQF